MGAVAGGEGPVGVAGEFEFAVVDLGVVFAADGGEVDEVGESAVFPPDQVVEFGVEVVHVAAGDNTARVSGA